MVMVATRDIPAGTELVWDYGDRDRATLAAHPWLARTARRPVRWEVITWQHLTYAGGAMHQGPAG